MRALLVLNRVDAAGVGVIVNLHTNILQRKVLSLLGRERKKEAFELLVSEAMVESYLPSGTVPRIKPELTLVEGA